MNLTKGVQAQLAADVNAIVKRFKFFPIYCATGCGRAVPPNNVLLQGFILRPFYPGDILTGGCVQCGGRGQFKPYTLHHHELRAGVRGPIFMSQRTRFLEGILRPGAIGRVAAFKLKLRPIPTPVRIADTCVGADTTTDLVSLSGPLPLIPCNQPVPRDPPGNFLTPWELSSTQQQEGEISGHVSGNRWISLFKIHGNCGLDAQATARKYQQLPLMWHVNGQFQEFFSTGTATTPGKFCLYIQTGGLYQQIADGRLTLVGEAAFYAGDTIRITGATTVSPNAKALNLFSGYASASEYLWIFISTTPCASTAEAQHGPSYGVFDTQVRGNFSQALTSVPLPSSSYECAYLQLGGAPTSTGLPTGPTLATASQFITVS